MSGAGAINLDSAVGASTPRSCERERVDSASTAESRIKKNRVVAFSATTAAVWRSHCTVFFQTEVGFRGFWISLGPATVAKNATVAGADHFEDILDMVDIGSGAKRLVEDRALSRYDCYLIRELGGTMPEDLPVADSIKQVELREKKAKQLEQAEKNHPQISQMSANSQSAVPNLRKSASSGDKKSAPKKPEDEK
jgi:hypothetical protein